MMEFTFGWIAVFILVAALAVYMVYHIGRIPFKSHAHLKKVLMYLAYFGMGALSLVYFYLFFSGKTQTTLTNILMYISGIFLCMLFYSIAMFFIYDIVRIINRISEIPEKVRKRAGKIFYGGLTVFIISALITVTGFIPAHKIVTTEFETTVSKKESGLNELKIAAISDAHTGVTIKEKELYEIVDKIDELKPDVIFLLGDIFDEGTTDELKEAASKAFSNLQAPYGMYFILGNHDDYTGNTEKELEYINKSGVTILLNDYVKVDDAFYLIGREDHQNRRTALAEIEKEMIDEYEKEPLPTIVLDHRPDYMELETSDIADIQLSGHTHNGQIFPIQTFDLFDFSMNYGLHEKGDAQILVSSGVGNYGIPIRIGSPCEIVDLTIKFQ